MAKSKSESNGSKPYVIIRAAQAGCFAGILESRTELPSATSVVLSQARRLWYWAGAASLSQLAQEGTSRPRDCKFPPVVVREEVIGVVEILDVTEQARISIEGVPAWRA